MAVNDKDLQLALIIKAQADQAKAQLQQVRAELVGVNAETAKSAGASQAAAGAAQAEAAAVQEVAAAQTTRAESDAEASARIHAMVQASTQAVDAERARAQAAIEAATASRAGASADSAAAKSTAELVAAQNAQMTASSRVVSAQAAIAAAVSAKTLTEEQSLEAEAMINRARAAGLITAAEQRQAIEQLAAVKVIDARITDADTKALVENTAASKLNYRARREVGTIAAEALSGNFGRVRTSGLALANDMGAFTKLLSPMGAGIAGVVGALALLTAGFVKGQEESAKFNAAIQTTGNYAGVTADDIHAMAQGMAGDATLIGQAKDALLAVVSSGKFAGDSIRTVAQAAIDMARTTGVSVSQAVQDFEQLGRSPAEAAAKLNEQYHFLTASIYEQITALEEEGNTTQAAALAQDALAQHFAAAAADQEEHLGALQREWNALKFAASSAWDAILGIGRVQGAKARFDSVAEDLAGLAQNGLVRYDASQGVNSYVLTQAGQHADIGSGDLTREIEEYKALRAAADAANKSATDKSVKQRQESDAIAAEAALAAEGKGYDKAAERAAAYKTVVGQLNKLLKDGRALPAGITEKDGVFSGAAFDYRVDKLAGISKSGGGAGPDLRALQTQANVAAIQHSLSTLANAWANAQKTLQAQHQAGKLSDQDYFDTLRKDLDTYTAQRIATLEQEKAAVLAGAKTQADRIRADQKAAQIDGEITQAQQDAAAKREQIDTQEQQAIAKTEQAWLDLRASLGLPADVNTAKAMKKLQDLYTLLQKLKDAGKAPSDADVNSMIGAALMTGVPGDVRLRSTRNIPGQNNRDNPLALVNDDRQNEETNFAAQKAQLAQNYAAAQALAKGNDAKLLQIQQQYQTDSEGLATSHKQAMDKINQAEYWGRLQVASTVLGQLATLSTSHNRKLAAIGKAASIAQTIITTYESATTAYKEGLVAGGPYAGPALGAVYAAIAIAAGMANVAAIRSQPAGGYAVGGYTGNSPVTQAVGLVHGREGVLSAPEVASIGGEVGFNNLRAMIRRGYASGGFVHPMDNAPSPADLGFASQRPLRTDLRQMAASNDDAHARSPQVGVRIVNVVDPKQVGEYMASSEGEKVIMNTISRNQAKVKAIVGS